jgi:hypothetical protein
MTECRVADDKTRRAHAVENIIHAIEDIIDYS